MDVHPKPVNACEGIWQTMLHASQKEGYINRPHKAMLLTEVLNNTVFTLGQHCEGKGQGFQALQKLKGENITVK